MPRGHWDAEDDDEEEVEGADENADEPMYTSLSARDQEEFEQEMARWQQEEEDQAAEERQEEKRHEPSGASERQDGPGSEALEQWWKFFDAAITESFENTSEPEDECPEVQQQQQQQTSQQIHRNNDEEKKHDENDEKEKEDAPTAANPSPGVDRGPSSTQHDSAMAELRALFASTAAQDVADGFADILPEGHPGMGGMKGQMSRADMVSWYGRLYERRMHRVVQSYIRKHGLASHHVESYEFFVQKLLPKIIVEDSPYLINCTGHGVAFRIYVDKVRYERPTVRSPTEEVYEMLPREAHRQKQTLLFDVLIDLAFETYRDPLHKNFPRDSLFHPLPARKDRLAAPPVIPEAKVPYVLTQVKNDYGLLFCRVPSMTSTTVCHTFDDWDHPIREPGTLWCNGMERAMIPQETLRFSYPFVFKITNKQSKYAYQCEIRSGHVKVRSSSTIDIFITEVQHGVVPEILVNVPYIEYPVPLALVFRMLGVDDIDTMCGFMVTANDPSRVQHMAKAILMDELSQAAQHATVDDLADWLGKQGTQHTKRSQRIYNVKHAFGKEFFPHYRDVMGMWNRATDEGGAAEEEEEEAEAERKEGDEGKPGRAEGEEEEGQACAHVEGQSHEPTIINDDAQNEKSSGSGDNDGDGDNGTNKRTTTRTTGGGAKAKKPSTNKKTPDTVATTKAIYLGYCVRRLLLTAMGLIEPDDKDHFINKSVRMAGMLFATLTRQLVKQCFGNLKNQVSKAGKKGREIDLTAHFNERQITQRLRHACSTGNWSVQKGSKATGVCQGLSPEMGLLARLALLTQVNFPLMREGKDAGPRQLSNARFGLLGAIESPEGKGAGLVNHKTLLARGRNGYIGQEREIITVLYELTNIIPAMNIMGHSRTNAQPRTLVLINGIVCGVVEDPVALVERYRELKRSHTLPIDSNVSYFPEHNEVRISADGEALYRPLVRLERFHRFEPVFQRYKHYLHLLWPMMLREGVIEYINKEEEATIFVVSSYDKFLDESLRGLPVAQEYTHMELNPGLAALGAVASTIVHAFHNQSPRNTYQCAMGKQASATLTVAQLEGLPAKVHTLGLAQKGLVATAGSHLIGHDEQPTGATLTVAIMARTGFPQDDGQGACGASLDLGALRTYYTRTVRDTESRHGGDAESFTKDFTGVKMRRAGNRDKVDADGLVSPGIVAQPKDVLMAKIQQYNNLLERPDPAIVAATTAKQAPPPASSSSTTTTTKKRKADASANETNPNHNATPAWAGVGSSNSNNTNVPLGSELVEEAAIGPEVRKDRSMNPKLSEPMTVTRVAVSSIKDAQQQAHVTIVAARTPCIGDKLATCHGQKGVIVVTIPREDMPYDIFGRTPDLIMNPHSIPGRMTIAELLEGFAANACALYARRGDGSPARRVTAADLQDMSFLRSQFGHQQLYCGKTGLPLQDMVFVVQLQVQRLKHMVDDKIHARARGPNQNRTRQPTEGRAKDGGLRLGEMERDLMVSHGVPAVMLERMMHASDGTHMPLCAQCGFVAENAAPAHSRILNVLHQKPYCRVCRSSEHIDQVYIPFATLLLTNELRAMGVNMQMFTAKTLEIQAKAAADERRRVQHKKRRAMSAFRTSRSEAASRLSTP